MPSLSSVRTLSTCCLLVAGFFTEIAQQIHSLRARGVRFSHAASASASAARVFRKSSGNSWTTPPEISLLILVIRLSYYKLVLSRKTGSYFLTSTYCLMRSGRRCGRSMLFVGAATILSTAQPPHKQRRRRGSRRGGKRLSRRSHLLMIRLLWPGPTPACVPDPRAVRRTAS